MSSSQHVTCKNTVSPQIASYLDLVEVVVVDDDGAADPGVARGPGQVREVRVVQLLRRALRAVRAQVHHQTRDAVKIVDKVVCGRRNKDVGNGVTSKICEVLGNEDFWSPSSKFRITFVELVSSPALRSIECCTMKFSAMWNQ